MRNASDSDVTRARTDGTERLETQVEVVTHLRVVVRIVDAGCQHERPSLSATLYPNDSSRGHSLHVPLGTHPLHPAKSSAKNPTTRMYETVKSASSCGQLRITRWYKWPPGVTTHQQHHQTSQ